MIRSKYKVLLALFSSLIFVAPSFAATLKGTVLLINKKNHSFALAQSGGSVVSVHYKGHAPKVTKTVTVTASALKNGTYSANKIKVTGTSTRSKVKGTVTHVNRGGKSYVVSARGVSITIKKKAKSKRSLSASSLPTVGGTVTCTLNFTNRGELQESSVKDNGIGDTSSIPLEGIILSVDEDTNSITLTAGEDGFYGSAEAITVILPDTFDITTFVVGDVAELAATLNDDGTYTAVYSSDDTSEDGANNPSDDQGTDPWGDLPSDGSGDDLGNGIDPGNGGDLGGTGPSDVYKRSKEPLFWR